MFVDVCANSSIISLVPSVDCISTMTTLSNNDETSFRNGTIMSASFLTMEIAHSVIFSLVMGFNTSSLVTKRHHLPTEADRIFRTSCA